MNPVDFQKLHDKYISRYGLFGVEKEYQNLNDYEGPDVPQWLKGETLYELYVRAFSEEGTFEGVRKNINRLLDLGIRVVWFMPIYPIGLDSRKGENGCPYAIRDYFTVNPEYGTEEDFKKLIAELHDNGIRVIIDMVANHVSPDYKYLQVIPNLIQRDENGTPLRAVDDWQDIADLDYTNSQTRIHMRKVLLHWVKEYDIDGYRCDVAGMIPLDFWESIILEIRKIKPDFYMLAEWDSTLLHREVFHSSYDWILYSIFVDLIKGDLDTTAIIEWLQTKQANYPANSLFLRFLENHDKVRAVTVFENESIYPFLTLLFSLDGLPLVNSGQETGDPTYLSLFNKITIDWNSQNTRHWEIHKRLIGLRRKYAGMYSGEYEFLELNQNKQVLAFMKGTGERLIVLINFSTSKVTHDLFEHYGTNKTNIIFNTHSTIDTDQLLPYQAIIASI